MGNKYRGLLYRQSTSVLYFPCSAQQQIVCPHCVGSCHQAASLSVAVNGPSKAGESSRAILCGHQDWKYVDTDLLFPCPEPLAAGEAMARISKTRIWEPSWSHPLKVHFNDIYMTQYPTNIKFYVVLCPYSGNNTRLWIDSVSTDQQILV